MKNNLIGCSIIIPTWNRNELLKRALQSVRRAKKNHAVEVIVIDNGSQPPAQIKDFDDLNIQLIRREENEGPSVARNRGIEKSSYNIIFPLDDDDELTDDAIDIFLSATTLSHIQKAPIIFLACSLSNLKHEFEMYTFLKYVNDPYNEVKPLINKELFLKTGFRYPNFKIGAEGILWIELLRKFDLPIINKIITISHKDANIRLTDVANQLHRACEYMYFQKELITLVDKITFNQFYKRRILGYTCYAILAKKKLEAISFLFKQKLDKNFLLKNILLMFLPAWLFKHLFYLYRIKLQRTS